MRNIAIIPARGGSKRIPGKNIKLFAGKPIIAYSIEAALNSGLFEEVMVSTDSEAIAAIAKEYGAKVPSLRSAKAADDHASISEVMLEVIEDYTQRKRTFDQLCCIFATAPFITATLIQRAYKQLQSGDYSSIVSVQQFHYPILRSLKINEAGYLEMNWPEHAKTRSQDLAPAFHDAGQFYWAKVNDYLIEKRFFSQKAGYLVLSDLDAHDIDTEEDWRIAELKYKMIHHND